MKKNRLIIFTVNYPYSKGEEFLLDELQILSKKFNSIKIVPAIVKGSSRENNFNNVTIDRTLYCNTIINITYGINSVPIIIRDLIKNENGIIKSLTNLRTTLVYIIRGMRLYGWYKRKYMNTNINNNYYYFYWSNSEAYGASLIKRSLNKNLLYFLRAHGGDLYTEQKSSRYLPYRNCIYMSCNHVFPVSIDGYNYLKRKHKYLENKLTVARLGINCNDKQISKAKPYNKNIIHIVSCSYDSPVKRVWLIRQFVIALSENITKKVIWTHIGIKKDKFKEKYINSNLPCNCIINSKGILSNTDVRNYYKETNPDLFINLSEAEGVPVSIMEAMCSSIPVIATDVGGTRELVNNDVGFLVEKDPNINTLVLRVMEKLENISEMSQAARKRVNEIFDAKRNYSNFANCIISLEK